MTNELSDANKRQIEFLKKRFAYFIEEEFNNKEDLTNAIRGIETSISVLWASIVLE